MNWLKAIFSPQSSKKHSSNLNSKKSFAEKYQELGVFNYDENGFNIKTGDFEKYLSWNDVTQINVYKTDLLTIDRIDMEIVYGDRCLTISEDTPGWYQFVMKTKEIFQTIPKDWDGKITDPAFAENYSTIYDKAKLSGRT